MTPPSHRSVAVREKLSRSIKLKSANPPPFYISRVSLYPPLPPDGWGLEREEKRFFFSLVVFFGGGLHHHHQRVRVPLCPCVTFYLFIYYYNLGPNRSARSSTTTGLYGLLGRLYSNQFELEIQPPRVTREEEEEERKRKNADWLSSFSRYVNLFFQRCVCARCVLDGAGSCHALLTSTSRRMPNLLGLFFLLLFSPERTNERQPAEENIIIPSVRRELNGSWKC